MVMPVPLTPISTALKFPTATVASGPGAPIQTQLIPGMTTMQLVDAQMVKIPKITRMKATIAVMMDKKLNIQPLL